MAQPTGLRLARLDTAMGPMLAALTGRGLAALARGDDFAPLAAALNRRFPRVAWIDVNDDGLSQQLDEYLGGARQLLDVRLDLEGLAAFDRRVLRAACDIPYAETATYGELAARLGHPAAARAVGNALSRCPFSVVVPCHRVVRASDGLSGRGANLIEMRRLLALERDAVLNGGPWQRRASHKDSHKNAGGRRAAF